MLGALDSQSLGPGSMLGTEVVFPLFLFPPESTKRFYLYTTSLVTQAVKECTSLSPWLRAAIGHGGGNEGSDL